MIHIYNLAYDEKWASLTSEQRDSNRGRRHGSKAAYERLQKKTMTTESPAYQEAYNLAYDDRVMRFAQQPDTGNGPPAAPKSRQNQDVMSPEEHAARLMHSFFSTPNNTARRDTPIAGVNEASCSAETASPKTP